MTMKGIILGIFVVLLSLSVSAESNIENNDFSSSTSFEVDPGILPDSPFYFLDTFMEERSLGHDPERALQFKGEKMAEAKAMAAKGNKALTKEVLDRAYDYGQVLEKEVTPEMEERVKKSVSNERKVLDMISHDAPELNENVLKNIDQGEKTALAAKVSHQIKELCGTLAKLDSVAYAQTCKITDNSPTWLREEHRQLTKDQEEQTKVFASKLTDCFNNPSACDCKGMGVKSFEEICMKASRVAAECQKGDSKVCDVGESIQFDPKEYLPDYLIPIFEEKMKMQGPGKMSSELIPDLCKKEGAMSKESCQKIMMTKYLPSSCKEAGVTTQEECMTLMKSEHGDYPAPCKEAGVNTEVECSKIMQKWGNDEREKGFSDHMSEIMPSDIKEKVKQCLSISDLNEKEKCFQTISTTFKDDHISKGEDNKDHFEQKQSFDWQEQYKSKWMNAQSEEERLAIRTEMMQEMQKKGYGDDSMEKWAQSQQKNVPMMPPDFEHPEEDKKNNENQKVPESEKSADSSGSENEDVTEPNQGNAGSEIDGGKKEAITPTETKS